MRKRKGQNKSAEQESARDVKSDLVATYSLDQVASDDRRCQAKEVTAKSRESEDRRHITRIFEDIACECEVESCTARAPGQDERQYCK
jgi:hypothetical protein